MTAIITIAVIILIYLYLSAPNLAHHRADCWNKTLFAHRGLFGGDIIENTIEAFMRAQDAGYASELDVQMTRDGALIVFHDDDLRRLAGDPRRPIDMTLAEIREISLNARGTKVPTFDEVLEAAGEKGKFCVEIKSTRKIAEVTRKTIARLRAYNGKYVVESFDPMCLFWLRRNAPDIIRGQLIGRHGRLSTRNGWLSLIMQWLMTNVATRPDFIAYELSLRKNLPIVIQRALFRTPLAIWTIRDKAALKSYLDTPEMPIFEEGAL